MFINNVQMHTQTFGFALIGIGISILVTGADINYSRIVGSSIIPAAALLVVAGVLTIIVCSFGILGAGAGWQRMLVVVRSLVLYEI